MKPKTPKLNVRLLRKIQRAILKHHDQFEMSSYFQSRLYFPNAKIENKRVDAGGCGTAACIAGWAVHIHFGKKKVETSAKLESRFDTWDKASELIGILSASTQANLFLHRNWPEPFMRQYELAITPESRAKVAVARISYFIETGE